MIKKLLAVGLLVWAVLLWLLPESVYWRDSGEFIVAATFLDITHPGGFPLYSQVANLFTLLPFGSIAWRVHLFSSLMGSVALVLSAVSTYRVLRRIPDIQPVLAQSLSTLVPIILICSPAFLRQSSTAEVYIFHLVISQVLFLLWETSVSKTDFRFLVMGGFIAGLGLGNHASLMLSLLFMAPAAFFYWRWLRPAIAPIVVAAVLGFLVYAYLPARSSTNPPLNTGAPDTAHRLIQLLTDARDRDLKQGFMSEAATPPVLSAEHVTKLFTKDLKTLSAEVTGVLLILGILGLLWILIQDRPIGLAIWALFLGNWVFFSGWSADPWCVSLWLLGLGTCTALARIFSYSAINSLTRHNLKTVSVSVVAVIAASLAYRLSPLAEARLLRSFELPSEEAKSILDSVPFNTVLVTETSWFLLKYLQAIEGYREDVPVVYQPRILFPAYFEPQRLTISDKDFSTWPSVVSALPREADLENLSRLIKFSSGIIFEPNVTINRYLGKATSFENGLHYIRRSGKADLTAEHIEAISKRFIKLASEAGPENQIAEDTRHYLETVLIHEEDLFEHVGSISQAVLLHERVCGTVPSTNCSLNTWENHLVYLARAGRSSDALKLGQALSNMYPGQKSLDHKMRALRQKLALPAALGHT